MHIENSSRAKHQGLHPAIRVRVRQETKVQADRPQWALIFMVSWLTAFSLILSHKYTGVNESPGETGLAALSLLVHSTISNPHNIPTGPTAHVSPLMTLIMAGVFATFDGNTPAARVWLSIISAGAYLS